MRYLFKSRIGLLTAFMVCSFSSSMASAKELSTNSFPQNVNLTEVRSTWLGWYNTERKKEKLVPYTFNSVLDATALVWSETAKQRGYLNHKRDGQTSYYDYNLIKKWFAAQGVIFKGSGTLFTENIGWGPYNCTKKDCTQEMISTIRYTFDAYMAEKGKKYRPHYNSLMSSVYTKIGLGIVVDQKKGKLYLTVHYAVRPYNVKPSA